MFEYVCGLAPRARAASEARAGVARRGRRRQKSAVGATAARLRGPASSPFSSVTRETGSKVESLCRNEGAR
jgi:hypothetical protein